MVDQAFAGDGHRLKAAVRVGREAGDGPAVVHAPAILAGKILPQVTPVQWSGRSHARVTTRVGIVVVHAEQEGVDGLPGEAQALNAENGVGVHGQDSGSLRQHRGQRGYARHRLSGYRGPATKIPGLLFLGPFAVLSHPLRLVFLRLLLALSCGGALLGLDAWQRPAAPAPARAVWPDAAPAPDLGTLQVVERGPVPMPAGMAAAHASTLLAMPAGHPAALTVFWFSGDRESGPNVQIAASQYVRATRHWTPARFVVNRFVMGEQLGFGLRRLGNPVAWMDGQGQINLFVVATGGGGWAASRVLHLRQSSLGQALDELAFAPVRVLPLSWLWNTSHLVRNAPLPLADGGMVLPVHFELGIKYPLALRFDRAGGFQGMVRMSQRPYWLQPALVQQSEHVWLALMRDERHMGKVGVTRTEDGGLHWTDLPDLTLDNPDAAVAGLGLAPEQMLLAHNSSIASRGTLDLSGSRDGRSWQRIQTLEHGKPDDEFSYPALLWLDGSLWVTYTVDRHRIAWIRLQPGGSVAGIKP